MQTPNIKAKLDNQIREGTHSSTPRIMSGQLMMWCPIALTFVGVGISFAVSAVYVNYVG